MKTNSYIVSIVIAIIATCGSSYAQPAFTGKPQYQIEVKRADTSMGKIIVEMFPAIAPNHVRNWDSLVRIHFYDSIAFHRVIPGFMIQGGDPNSRSGPKETWGQGEDGQQTVDAEFSAVSHRRGILSAARTPDPNSATSQFFICIANPTYLDRQYTVYGKVISGMDIADMIVGSDRDGSDNPFEKISMFITPLGSNDSTTATPRLAIPIKDSILPLVTKATLRWHKIPDAMMYRVQVAKDLSFSAMLLDTTRSQVDTTLTVTNLKKGNQYFWRVLANNGGNESQYSEPWNFIIESLGVEESISPKIDLKIFQHSVDRSATLHFTLNEPAMVSIDIYDLLGRNILSPISSKILSSANDVTFTNNMLPSGFYFCRFSAGGKSIIRQLAIE